VAGVFGETFQDSTDHLNSEGLANVFIVLEPFGLSTQGAWFLRSLFLSAQTELTGDLQRREDEYGSKPIFTKEGNLRIEAIHWGTIAAHHQRPFRDS